MKKVTRFLTLVILFSALLPSSNSFADGAPLPNCTPAKMCRP